LPKNFSECPNKTAILTCKIGLPDSPTRQLLLKIPDFRHYLYLTRHNEFRFFRLINTKKYNFSSFLAAGFCPKNNRFARVWGLQPPPLARTPMWGPIPVGPHQTLQPPHHLIVTPLRLVYIFCNSGMFSKLELTEKSTMFVHH